MCNKANDSDQEHVLAVLSRREVLKAGAAAAIIPFFGGEHYIAHRLSLHIAETQLAPGTRWSGPRSFND